MKTFRSALGTAFAWILVIGFCLGTWLLAFPALVDLLKGLL